MVDQFTFHWLDWHAISTEFICFAVTLSICGQYDSILEQNCEFVDLFDNMTSSRYRQISRVAGWESLEIPSFSTVLKAGSFNFPLHIQCWGLGFDDGTTWVHGHDVLVSRWVSENKGEAY